MCEMAHKLNENIINVISSLAFFHRYIVKNSKPIGKFNKK